MPHPLLTVSQTDYLIQIVDINSHTEWQRVQIQISWLLQIYTVCKGRVWPGSAGLGLKHQADLQQKLHRPVKRFCKQSRSTWDGLYEPSYQDLHCLPVSVLSLLCLPFVSIFVCASSLIEVTDIFHFRDGRVQFRNSGMRGLKLILLLCRENKTRHFIWTVC